MINLPVHDYSMIIHDYYRAQKSPEIETSGPLGGRAVPVHDYCKAFVSDNRKDPGSKPPGLWELGQATHACP